MVLFKLFLILLCSIPWTVPQTAQHCSSAAVWFGVRVPVISSASITSPCDTVQLPNCTYMHIIYIYICMLAESHAVACKSSKCTISVCASTLAYMHSTTLNLHCIYSIYCILHNIVVSIPVLINLHSLSKMHCTDLLLQW